MWKNESALAAHRQIGRMLHNHYEVHGTGLTKDEAIGSNKPKAFELTDTEQGQCFINFQESLNDVTLRHTARSIGVVLTVFRFFLSFLKSRFVFLPLTCVAMCIFQTFLLPVTSSSGVLVHESLFYAIKMHIKSLILPKFRGAVCVDRWNLNPFPTKNFPSLSDYVITFDSVFMVFNDIKIFHV